MTFRRTIALGATSLALVVAGTVGTTAQSQTIRIGSDNFYESKLAAEIYAQVLEGAGWTVDRQFGLGSRPDREPAFEGGQVDLVPEYVGSGLGFQLKGSTDPKLTALAGNADGEATREKLQQAFDIKGLGITVLGITPGVDINATVVRPDTAQQDGLAKMSDLAAHQNDLKWGLPPDCDANPLCKDALEAYGITYPPTQREALDACSTPLAEALANKAVDVAWLCSTQPDIARFGFVLLDDDKHQQPSDNLAPLVRNDFLQKAGIDASALAGLLDPVSAMLTTEKLTELGVKIAVDQEDVEDVAKAFLATIQLPAGSPAASPAS